MAEQMKAGDKRVEQKLTCVNCGQVQNEFWYDNGKGYFKDGKIYCCQDCAQGTGCTCIVPGGGG